VGAVVGVGECKHDCGRRRGLWANANANANATAGVVMSVSEIVDTVVGVGEHKLDYRRRREPAPRAWT
jgi:hypothetical protein